MKLKELFEAEKKLPGTYAGVLFDDGTKNAIITYCKKNNIPNVPNKNKLHTTVLYSKKPCPDFKPLGEIKPPITGEPVGFDVWNTQPDEKGKTARILVLTFKCPKLVARHKALMKEHGATFDFDEYKPHITFSYDIGDMDIKDLPRFNHGINIVEEYHEDLDTDWATNNTSKS